MNRIEILKEADSKNRYFEEALGNIVYEAFMEDDNYMSKIGRSIINTFKACKTEREVEIADCMLAAICGWKIKSLLDRIK